MLGSHPQHYDHLERRTEYGYWRIVVKGLKTSGLDFDLEAVAPTIVVIMTEETPQTQHLSMLRGSWEGFSLFVCDR